VGACRTGLASRLAAIGPDCPVDKRAAAEHVLGRVCGTRVAATIDPSAVRLPVFRAAARLGDRDAALREVAGGFGLPPERLIDALFADLPENRVLGEPEEPLEPSRIALLCNRTIAQAVIRRATEVELEIEGNARAVFRQMGLRGLLCTPRGVAREGPSFRITGPLSLVRQTTRYGNALAGIVPLLPWCRRYSLEARCLLPQRGGASDPGSAPLLRFRIGSADPILPAREPRRWDSRIESRFERDFTRVAADWEVVREPAPVAVDGGFVYPDFLLRPRAEADRSWLCEIVGFWTADYLRRKLRRLRRARLGRLLLCIDRRLDCGGEPVPQGAPVVWFRERVDPREVLAAIEAEAGRERRA
jgi:predicted nuclease of restriction endonuclease-like RecB superfamily